MPRFGAHLSVAGGFDRAITAAQDLGFDTVQIFTKAPSQWAGRTISDKEAESFRTLARRAKLMPLVGHDSYLINLGSPDDTLWKRSIAAFIDEINRADQLGLDYLVTHPGAHCESGEEAGIRRVVAALDEVLDHCKTAKVQVLLETTAGQGTSLGNRFEHLQAMLNGAQQSDRLGVCLDTCHVLAAGYALSPRAEYVKTMRAFDKTIGLDRLKVFHVNDSKKPLGSRVDRHEHLGRGHVGLEAFRCLVTDRRFRNHPMILETPKEEGKCDTMDARNFSVLRTLMLRS